MIRAFVIVLLMCISCAPKGPEPWRQKHKVEFFVENQSKRTALFTELVGRGAIEFKWSDDKGTHKEQGELDFWKQGDAISMRVSKLGELLAWFGGEGKDFWFFDMMGDEPTLTVGGQQGMFNDIEVALVLLGLVPVPKLDASVNNEVFNSIDAQGRKWSATYEFEKHRPLHITMKEGDHEAEAKHLTGILVEIDNKHELYWPETGGNIDLTDNQGNTKIKIAFSFLSTIVVDEPMDRVFDLEYLKSALKPQHVLQGK